MKKYRLRYAPSPTGFLHIGNTRTALMNYLFAKHYNGDFIVRIEDTDLERNVEGSIESQFNNLEWLGIKDDESIRNNSKENLYGKYMQSEKFDIYLKHAQNLIESKSAYKCFCTTDELTKDYEEQVSRGIIATKYSEKCRNLSEKEIKQNLDNKKEYSIRFAIPKNKSWIIEDLVRGNVQFHSKDLGDFVIIKSNKIPTYNFAVVIDDHDMEISHVVRGEEHISNTPRQIMIFEALNWEYPKFCHLTLIVDSTGKKLSKRSGNALFFIEEYRKQGYLPEAIFNYIALLGWSPSTEQEIFPKEELIKIFNESRFSKSPSTFDMVKMKWINFQYLKRMSNEDFLVYIKPFIDKSIYNIDNKDENWLNEVLLLFKPEIEFGIQINNHLNLFFEDLKLEEEIIQILKSINNHEILINDFEKQITNTTDWTLENIKTIIKETSTNNNVKGKDLFMPIRIYSSKSEHGPSLANVIFLLGKQNVLQNISEVKKFYQTKC